LKCYFSSSSAPVAFRSARAAAWFASTGVTRKENPLILVMLSVLKTVVKLNVSWHRLREHHRKDTSFR
jgi:hypothetical protein